MPTNGKIKTASKEVPDGVAVSARVNGKFAPGQSGNPAGRPKVAPEEMALLDRIKSLSGKAVAALESVLDDPDAPAEAKIKASTAVFDRVLGKPRQEIDSNITQNIATPADFKPDLYDLRRKAMSFAQPSPDTSEAGEGEEPSVLQH
jgi:Family of unknown function (DUF5681)